MKIAFLTDTYWPRVNGVTVSTDIFMRQLKSLGHEVRLWAPDYTPKGADIASLPEEPGISRFRALTVFFSPEDRLPNPRFRKDLYAQLEAFSPDLIHVQTEVASWFVRAFAHSRRVPVVQTCHTYFEQYIGFYFPLFPPGLCRAYARWLTRRLVKTADTLVAPTQAMKLVIESYGIHTPVSVVPTGIDEEEFSGLDKDRERQDSLWLDRHPQWKGKPLLLCVCRIAQEKNVDFLLDVIERVRKEKPDTLLVMAGNGPYLEDFQAKVTQRGLAESVLNLGYVDRQELRHLYALADVFTFPSVTETQGLVTIEAMMCATPTVAIGQMGTKEVMGGDNGGFMVEADAAVFSRAVLRLLQDPALYRLKSAEARAHAQNWTARRMAQRIEALYRQVLETHQTAG